MDNFDERKWRREQIMEEVYSEENDEQSPAFTTQDIEKSANVRDLNLAKDSVRILTANLMQNGAKKKDIALYFSQFIENV
tara:strand:- start:4351 stop:4590 length:240 start_codon:yes stop_codon:yes gene_type:complete